MGEDIFMRHDYHWLMGLKVDELKRECRDRRLRDTGMKKVLRDRLIHVMGL